MTFNEASKRLHDAVVELVSTIWEWLMEQLSTPILWGTPLWKMFLAVYIPVVILILISEVL
jgi:uncharacterized membrane protein